MGLAVDADADVDVVTVTVMVVVTVTVTVMVVSYHDRNISSQGPAGNLQPPPYGTEPMTHSAHIPRQ